MRSTPPARARATCFGAPITHSRRLLRVALALVTLAATMARAAVAQAAAGGAPVGAGRDTPDAASAAVAQVDSLPPTAPTPPLDSARVVTESGARRSPDASADAAKAAARFTSRADSVNFERTRRAASLDGRFRVVVSLLDRRVAVLRGTDTLRAGPAAVATGGTFAYEGRVWTFNTPRGRHRVLSKEVLPLWTPPDWHYAEVARDNGLRLAKLPPGRGLKLQDGTWLTVRDRVAGIIRPGTTEFLPLPTDEEIVFDETLFIPPIGTINRRIVGELGRYRLDLGQGYYLHGTPEKETVGQAVTHGCVRLLDEDIEWLYANVPVGTPVYIY